MSNNHGVQRVISDVFELCDLQWRLLAIDGQEARQRLGRAVGLVATGVALGSAALITLTIGLGFVLHELSGLSVGASLVITAAAVFTISGILMFISYQYLRGTSRAFHESKSELVENIKWLKAVIISPDRSPRNQVRSESFPLYPEDRFRNAPKPDWETLYTKR